MLSFHSHSKDEKRDKIIDRLLKGENAAIVTDAWTPWISDPWYTLTSEAVKQWITLVPIPWASAFLTALQSSGVSIDKFVYLWFLPIKKWRQTLFKSLKEEKKTVVFYESVHRIQKTISQLIEYLGEDKKVVIARELTKMYEEFFRWTLKEASEHFTSTKGEFVVILPA